MYDFRNSALRRDYRELLANAINLERGNVGTCSIEVETDDPKSFESYVYNGSDATKDREHDYLILEKLFKEKTTD